MSALQTQFCVTTLVRIPTVCVRVLKQMETRSIANSQAHFETEESERFVILRCEVVAGVVIPSGRSYEVLPIPTPIHFTVPVDVTIAHSGDVVVVGQFKETCHGDGGKSDRQAVRRRVPKLEADETRFNSDDYFEWTRGIASPETCLCSWWTTSPIISQCFLAKVRATDFGMKECLRNQ